MKSLNEMIELVENKTAQVLTIETAKELKGEKIQTIYFGYRHQDHTEEFVVGDVVSELEYYRNLKEDCYPDGRFNNRAEYWESFMTPAQLQERKDKLFLVTADGRNTYIYGYENHYSGIMNCSDDGRYVYFIKTGVVDTKIQGNSDISRFRHFVDLDGNCYFNIGASFDAKLDMKNGVAYKITSSEYASVDFPTVNELVDEGILRVID